MVLVDNKLERERVPGERGGEEVEVWVRKKGSPQRKY